MGEPTTKRRYDSFHLAEVLDKLGWTQAQLSRKLGCSESWISALVNGRRSLKWDTAVSIARVLGVSLDELAGRPPFPRPR